MTGMVGQVRSVSKTIKRRAVFFTIAMGISAPVAMADTPWRGFLWPVKTERAYELSLGQFESLDACRRIALIRILASGWKGGADWECGLNCVPASFPKGAWTCEDRTQ